VIRPPAAPHLSFGQSKDVRCASSAPPKGPDVTSKGRDQDPTRSVNAPVTPTKKEHVHCGEEKRAIAQHAMARTVSTGAETTRVAIGPCRRTHRPVDGDPMADNCNKERLIESPIRARAFPASKSRRFAAQTRNRLQVMAVVRTGRSVPRAVTLFPIRNCFNDLASSTRFPGQIESHSPFISVDEVPSVRFLKCR
jgi:hypothetical protein